MSTNAKDCDNWYRLALSLEVCVKPLLLDILHDVKHGGLPRDPSLLHAKLLHIKTTVGIPHIIHYQWDILCPNKGKTNSNDFDITLIVALIKGLKILPEPKGGWSKPNPNDNSRSANVVRAKNMRNRINHANMPSFTDNKTFERIRKEIRAILLGLGVTDFKEFDSLENASLDHRVEEKVNVLVDKINDIKSSTDQELLNQHDKINVLKKEIDNIRQNTHSNIDEKLSVLKENLGELQLDVQVLKNELPKLQSEVQVIHSRIDCVANTNVGRTLHFHLILKQTSGLHFEEFDVKLNGPLHIHVVDQLQKYFQKYCDDIPDEIEITINEITPVENEARTQQEDKQMFPCIRFDCEVIHPEDPTYFYENFRDSLKSTKAKKIISDIETDLVSSMRDELHVESKILVRKWKVGSLFIDIAIYKINGKCWEIDEFEWLSNNFKKCLKKQFSGHCITLHNVTGHEIHNNIGTFCVNGSALIRGSAIEEDIGQVGAKHIELQANRGPCTEYYRFDRKVAGLIIGKKGSFIKKLEQIPRVIRVSIDTKSLPNHCILTVEAEALSDCRKVYEKVSRKANQARFPTYFVTLIESDEKETQILLKLYDVESSNIPVLPNRLQNLYTFQEFKTGKLSLDTSEKHQNDLIPFSIKAIEDTFENAVENIGKSTAQTIEFNIILGKEVFFQHKGCLNKDKITLDPDSNGRVNPYVHNIKPVYVTSINPALKDEIVRKLNENLFKCTNKDTPDVFTNVHLSVGDEKTLYSVRLALDKNLEKVHELTPLQKKQHEAIERICKATTVQEVLQPVDDKRSVKAIYLKLSKLVHPDKCQSHPGATEAWKRLKDAYEKVEKARTSDPVLDIDTKVIIRNSKPPRPPNVLSVRKRKNKICAITTFSQRILDVRASIVTMETRQSEDALGKEIRDVLDTCWENRNEDGVIKSPGKTEICIEMIKQITAGLIWEKEIETSNGTAVMEVQMNEIREKSGYKKEWKDCFEIDMKLTIEGRECKDMSAKEFTNDFLTIKDMWEKLCPTAE